MTRSVEIKATVFGLALALSCVLSACGKSGPGSPVAPSLGASPSGAPSSAGATISGRVNIGGGSASRLREVASGLTVKISGTSLSASVSSGRFELDDAPAGHVELQFEGQGVNARVDIGDVAEHERVELQITLNGSSGSLDASRHVSEDNEAEIKGHIASIDGASRSLQIGTSSVVVPSSAAIRSGSTQLAFSDLKVGLLVEIHGSLQGTVVNADEVNVEDEIENEGDAEFSGTIASLGGSCPALTMNVAGKAVVTGASTLFQNADCDKLANGMEVEVKGTVLANGTVSASRIQVEDNEDLEIEFTGSVTALGGTCPGITMTVAGKTVKAGSATTFDGGSYGSIGLGTTVEVKGVAQSDGSISASRVKVEDSGSDK
jgi:hypothetical protein